VAGLTPDVGAFLARLVRLDPHALVRVRVAGPDHFALWATVPWRVLVSRTVAASALVIAGATDDITVTAADWLARPDGDLSALARKDAAWRGALPASAGVVREAIRTNVVRDISAAAESTLRAVAGGALGDRGVGQRVVRDALLDHVPIVVEHDGERIDVPQRLIQAVARMGFLGADDDLVRIRTIGSWIGISAAYGVAWWRTQNALAPTLLPAPVRL
jgi:hypothetical protein